MRLNHLLLPSVLMALCAVVMPTTGWAQVSEVESNNSCTAAQSLGDLGSGVTVNGEIAKSDVDYYEITATPGSTVQIDMQGKASNVGTLIDSMVGVFSSSCEQLAWDDDSGNGSEAQLLQVVPDDGIVRIAAAAYPDFNFDASNADTGTYVLTIADPSASFLNGIVSDSSSGAPLTSGSVALVECDADDVEICHGMSSSAAINADGGFSFPLADTAAGSYQLQVWTSGYARSHGSVIQLGPDVGILTQNIETSPLKVQFSKLSTCEVSDTSMCAFSVKVTNTSSERQDIDVWARISTNQTGSPYLGTSFAIGPSGKFKPKAMTLAPGESQKFKAELPTAGLPTGASGYLDFYASSQGDQTDTLAFADGFGWTLLGDGSAELLPPVEAARRFGKASDAARLRGQARIERGDVVVAGTLTDADGTPLVGMLEVWMARCVDGAELCAELDASAMVNGRGSYVINATNLPAGRYQLWINIIGWDQAWSAPFDYDGSTSLSGINLVAAPATVTFSNLRGCSGLAVSEEGYGDLPEGASCKIHYDLTNTADHDLDLLTWAYVSIGLDGSDLGYSDFSAGKKGGFAPVPVTVPAGQTLTFAQSLPVETLPSGTYGSWGVMVSGSSSPMLPYAASTQGALSITP